MADTMIDALPTADAVVEEGAHLLLQTRVRTLKGELGTIFKR
jgi:hypothetical protein